MNLIKFCAFFLQKNFLCGNGIARLTLIIKNEENHWEVKA